MVLRNRLIGLRKASRPSHAARLSVAELVSDGATLVDVARPLTVLILVDDCLPSGGGDLGEYLLEKPW